jgi:hypothetical protein
VTRTIRHQAEWILVAAALAAGAPAVADAQVVRPVPSEQVASVRAFLQGYLSRSPADGAEAPRFTATTVELCRGTGTWIVVHLVAQHVCGSGGCTSLVLAPEKGGYRIVADIGPSQPPIMVLTDRTEGCHDLAVYQRGVGGEPGHFVVFLFDGLTYSEMPGDSPAHQRRASRGAVEVIAGSDSFGTHPVFDPAKPDRGRPSPR